MAKNFFEPKVSVIIPMYNAEKYIGECLQSLLSQTFKNFEVIVVDDCSTDNSVKVVENFSEKFEGRLNLIKMKKNFGCAAIPRNFAIKQARGKYIYFLDSDDFIEHDTFEKFFEAAENFDADVVHSEKFFEYRDENQNILTTYQQGEFVDKPTLETFDIGERVDKFVQKKTLWWSCNKFFRRNFLEENKIQFPKMKSFEDFVFTFCAVVSAKNFVRVPFVSYHYRIRQDSMSHRNTSLDETMQYMVEATYTMDCFMRNIKFFIDNSKKRYIVIDFFVQEIIDLTASELFIFGNYTVGEIYNFLVDYFQKISDKTAPATSHLFMTASIYKLLSKQQADQIADLKNQLAKFQS